MSRIKTFGRHGAARQKEPLHYRLCGLDDVYLFSGFTEKDTAYGPAVSIKDIDGLHEAIAAALVAQKDALTAKEFRFLRKHIGMTQEDLSVKLSVDAQTVARYEKGQTAIGGAADLVLRVIVSRRLSQGTSRQKIVQATLDTIETGLKPRSKNRRA